MSQSNELLRVRDLQIRVGEYGLLAVDGVSFDMAPGEIVALEIGRAHV